MDRTKEIARTRPGRVDAQWPVLLLLVASSDQLTLNGPPTSFALVQASIPYHFRVIRSNPSLPPPTSSIHGPPPLSPRTCGCSSQGAR
jgi:hypothetical protein